MRYSDQYTKVILSVIAGLLALNTLGRIDVPVVRAQTASKQYSIVEIKAELTTPSYLKNLEAAINDASKGREMVTMLPFDQAGRHIAVYKQAR